MMKSGACERSILTNRCMSSSRNCALPAVTILPQQPTRIYVDKASIVGSIGVMINGFGMTGLMDKLGIERRLLTAGEYKGFLDPFSPQTPQQVQYAQSMLNRFTGSSSKRFVPVGENV